jgi:hypothetical protein
MSTSRPSVWFSLPGNTEDVEDLGLLKLDVLGVRMQSAMAHAVAEIERSTGHRIDLDDAAQVPPDDPKTFQLIKSSQTLGAFRPNRLVSVTSSPGCSPRPSTISWSTSRFSGRDLSRPT